MSAVLLDRDGVINENLSGYVLSWEDFRFLPRSLAALSAFTRLNLRLAIVTNQSAVGRGLLAYDDLTAIHARMIEQCAFGGAAIEGVFVCPHAPWDGCACRKPRPGLFARALSALGERPDQCIAVGDSVADLGAAAAAGVPFVLVRSGRGERTLRDPMCRANPPVFVGRDLWEVAQTLPAFFQATRPRVLS